jgi:hypothetical protein
MGMASMHHLHILAWLIDKLAGGNRIAWILFLGAVLVLGICFIYDLRENKKKSSSA